MTTLAPMIDTQQITFSSGLPGFPDVRNFVLMNTELAQEPFSILKCLDEDDLEFVVTTPAVFFPDYAPRLTTPPFPVAVSKRLTTLFC